MRSLCSSWSIKILIRQIMVVPVAIAMAFRTTTIIRRRSSSSPVLFVRSFSMSVGVGRRPASSTRTTGRAGRAAWYNNRIQLDHYFYSRAATKSTTTRLFSSTASDDTEDNTKQYRVAFLGTPDVAATCLKSVVEASKLPESNYQVVAAITQPPKRRKRKKKPEPSPVGKIAVEELGFINYNVEEEVEKKNDGDHPLKPVVLCPDSAKDTKFLDLLEYKIKPDLCITAAYGQYLPKRFLQIPPLGTINIHPSLLPKYRGASPVQRSLEAGDNPVGVTVLYTVSKMDAGPVIAQQRVNIDKNAQATDVLPMLFELGTSMLVEDVLPSVFSGEMSFDLATPQDELEATQASMISADEAELDLENDSAITCHNRLRGFAYWPQVYMYVSVDGVEDPIKLKILQTRVVRDESTGQPLHEEPTDVINLGPNKKDGLYVTCGDGSVLELLTVQPATRKAFPARDFQNGYPNQTIRWITMSKKQ